MNKEEFVIVKGVDNMKEKYVCKNCGKPVAEFRGEWWHISHWGEYGFSAINLKKRIVIDWINKTCDSCGNEKEDEIVCTKPVPKESEIEVESPELLA